MSTIFARDPSKTLAVNARLIKRKSADNETLAPLGMKKIHADEFFYEVKREELSDRVVCGHPERSEGSAFTPTL